MNIYIGTVIFIFGLLTGSFLNLCIYRMPRGESPNNPNRSYCESCGSSLRLYEVIPVISYITSHGRCRHCNSKVSILHPLFEIGVGIVFTMIFIVTGLNFKLLVYLSFTCVLILSFFIDLKSYIIPNKVIIAGLITGICLTIYNLVIGDSWTDNLLGCLMGFMLFLITALISKVIIKKNGIGEGDIKLMSVIGLIMGLKYTIPVMFISMMLASVVCIVLIVLKKLKRQDKIPFGPFLAVSTMIIAISSL